MLVLKVCVNIPFTNVQILSNFSQTPTSLPIHLRVDASVQLLTKCVFECQTHGLKWSISE